MGFSVLKMEMPLKLFFLSGWLLLFQANHISGSKAPAQIPALGREAELGQFYDSISETFQTQKIFRQSLSSELIETNSISSLSSKSRLISSLGEKTTGFGFDIHLTFKIFFGLIRIKLDSGYKRVATKTTTADTMLMTFETRTEKKSIDVFYDDISNLIDKNQLAASKATHVVIAVEYGSDVMVELQDSNKFNNVKETSYGALGAIVKALANIFQGKGADNGIPGTLSPGAKLIVKIFGDISSNSNTPKTLDEVKNFIKQIPSLTKQYNNGLGKPVLYTLLPLNALRQQFMMRVANSPEVYEVDLGLQQRFVMTAEKMLETDAILSQLITDITDCKCIIPDDVQKVKNLNEDYQSYSESFKNTVKEAVLKIREGSRNNTFLEDILQDYKANPLSAESVYIQVREDLSNITEKLEMHKRFMENALTMEYWERWEPLAEVNPGRNVYVLYYSPKLAKNNPQVWEECSAIFFRLGRASSNKMIVLDCDFPASKCDAIEEVQLHQYRSGMLITNNVATELTVAEKLEPIQIPALGRFRSVGDLYNANEAQFLTKSIFSRDPAEIEVVEDSTQDSKILVVKDYSQRLSAGNVPPEVAVNIFTSQMELRGSWEVIDGHLSNVVTTGIYSFSLTTGTDTVTDGTFKESLQIPPSLESGATHFVQRIIYGFTTVVKMKLSEESECNRQQFQLDLENLKNFTETLFRNATEPEKDAEFNLRSNVRIEIFSDVLDSSLNLNTNKGGLKQFLLNLQSSMFSINEGKGRAMGYILEPLVNYRDHFGVLDIERFKPILTLEDYRQLVNIYNEIMEAKSEVEAWVTEFDNHSNCVQDNEKNILSDLRNRFDKQMALWLKDLKSAIDQNKPREFFETFKNLTHDFKISRSVVLKDLEQQLDWTMEKIRMLKDGLKKGIGYSGRNRIDFKKQSSTTTYVFHLKKEFKSQVALWWENLFVFHALQTDDVMGNGLFFLDCDIGGSTCGDVKGPVIYEYKEGEITSMDVVRDRWDGETVEENIDQTIRKLGNWTEQIELRLESMAAELTKKFEESKEHLEEVASKYCKRSAAFYTA